MEMKNMKLRKIEKNTIAEPCDHTDNSPKYPYGLSITLNNDSVETLGIDKKLPSVGDEVIIIAKATIESVSVRENNDKTKDRRVEIQITDMSIEEKKPDINIEKSMYGA